MSKTKSAKQAIMEQYLPLRPRKTKALEKIFTAAVDRVAGWDYEPTTGRLQHMQSEIAHRIDEALGCVRGAIAWCVPTAKKASKTVPPELLKLEQALHEAYRAAWDASHARWPQPEN